MPALRREDAPVLLTGAAAVCTVLSIAGFEVLMGLAFVALLVTRQKWRIPPIWLPLSLFFVGTLVSAAASGHFREGVPQLKKFYVYLMLFLVVTAFRDVAQLRWLVLGFALAGALSAAWGMDQFVDKYEEAQKTHQDFYTAYVGARITGFMDHWMTFSAQMMMALLTVTAVVFFSIDRRWIAWLTGAGGVITLALVAAETRSVWLATGLGGAYLIWCWRPWALLTIPVLAAVLLLTNPFGIGDRAMSVVRPHGQVDSNAHRGITRQIGYKMIRAHPWLGIGPEQVGRQYMEYLPPGTPLPLPTGYYGHLHNIYIHYAAELGVPTAIAMTWMFGQALWDFVRALRRMAAGAEERWVLQAAIAVTLAILAGGLFEKNIGDSEVLGMFLAVLGCGYVAVMRLEETCKA